MSPWALIGIGWGVMALIMMTLWGVQRVRRNAGIVDVAWSFGTGLLAGWFAWGWASVLGPIVMLFFSLKVTGVPMTEQCAIQSRGDAYREYQRTTNALFPGPPKAEATI